MNAPTEADARLAIVQYWHDEDIPPDIRELLATFPEHNPDFRHLVFSEATAERFLEDHCGRAELEAFRASAVPAMQADYFRYCAAYVLGGVCVDADCRCVASLRELVASGGEIFEGPKPNHAHNGFFGFGSAGHPLLRLAIDVATTNVEFRIADKVWVVAGPWVFGKLLRMWRQGATAHIEKARSGPEFVGKPHRLRYLDALQEKIGGDARVEAAFEGVRVSSLERAWTFIAHAGAGLAYKQSKTHFPNFEGSIYR